VGRREGSLEHEETKRGGAFCRNKGTSEQKGTNTKTSYSENKKKKNAGKKKVGQYTIILLNHHRLLEQCGKQKSGGRPLRQAGRGASGDPKGRSNSKQEREERNKEGINFVSGERGKKGRKEPASRFSGK